MQMHLQVTLNDGTTHECSTSLATIVAWERKFKRKASDLAQGIGVEDLAFMAHQALREAEIVVPLALDDFIKRCKSIDVVGADDSAPFESEPTDDN